MKRHLVNAACGVIDYAAYPLAMLFVGPFTLRRLGAAEFGLWMIAGAVISCGGIVASGFSDANLQRVSRLLQRNDLTTVRQTVQSIFAINIITGTLLAAIVALAAPWLAARVEAHQPAAAHKAALCFWIAAGCIPLRAMHAAAVSTQRAFQDFRASVRISATTHLFTLGMAALLVLRGLGPASILAFNALFLLLATSAQCREVSKLLGARAFVPAFHRQSVAALLSCGIYAWLQTFGSVIADRIDRLLLGASLGAAAVAPYALCVQLAQPLTGITGSGLSFLMPHFASNVSPDAPHHLRRKVLAAISANLIIVVAGVALTLFFGNKFLPQWVGSTTASATLRLFPRIVCGSAMLALSVSGIYALQALGSFRVLAAFTLGSRFLLLPLMLWLLHHEGADGLATYRLLAGAAALTVYMPVLLQTQEPSHKANFCPPATPPHEGVSI